MPDPRQTDERLRTWLNTNQPMRERMCAALLSLQSRYTEVRSRRPEGGPDGARDIEAVLDGRLRVWGAVGFQNSVCDSNAEKRAAQKKFKSDLDSAKREEPALAGFVFFTNVDLTPGELQDLRTYGEQTHGLQHVEIWHRESIRMVLDADPKAFVIRMQYLALPMSESEQVAFFSAFGGTLESLVTNRLDQVDERLRRLEFLAEAAKPLLSVRLTVRLKQSYPVDELGHFRALLGIYNLRDVEDGRHPGLHIAARDAYATHVSGEESQTVYMVRNLAWSTCPDAVLQDSVTSGEPGLIWKLVPAFSFASVRYATETVDVEANVYKKPPFERLADLDDKSWFLHVSEGLADRIERIGFAANDYVLFDLPMVAFNRRQVDPLDASHMPLSDVESANRWVELSTPAFLELDFGRYTPMKM